MNNLEDLKKLLDEKGQKVTDVNILFLDLSSTCTGFSLAKVNFETRTANFTSAGSCWIPQEGETKEIEHLNKCGYVNSMISNYFAVVDGIDYVVMEKYSINSKRMSGVLLTPMLHGSVLAALSECGLKYSYTYPQSWRAQLGIKKLDGDFKGPTKTKVLEYVQVPETVKSNITHQERNTSSDLYDALAIGIAYLQKIGIRHMNFKSIKFQPHVGILNDKGNF